MIHIVVATHCFTGFIMFCRYKLFPVQRGAMSGFGMPPANRRPVADDANQNPAGHRWGQGNQLGGM